MQVRVQTANRGWGDTNVGDRNTFSNSSLSQVLAIGEANTSAQRATTSLWSLKIYREMLSTAGEWEKSRFSEPTEGVWGGKILQYSSKKGIHLPSSTRIYSCSLCRSVRQEKDHSHSLYDFPRNDTWLKETSQTETINHICQGAHSAQ